MTRKAGTGSTVTPPRHVPEDPDDIEAYRRRPLHRGAAAIPLRAPDPPVIEPQDVMSGKNED